jgi:hypothetical protein
MLFVLSPVFSNAIIAALLMRMKCHHDTAVCGHVCSGRCALLIHGKKKIPLFGIEKIKVVEDA